MNAPLTRTEESVLQEVGNKVTTWDYDDDYDPVPNQSPTPLLSRLVEQGYTKDVYGSPQPYEYVTIFTYNTKGQVVSIDGPRPDTGDTTSFAYHAETGDLESITRPHIGSAFFSEYDAAGRPGRMTDVNNRTRGISYDGRGRITALTNHADNTPWYSQAFEYDELNRLVSASGRYGLISYAYDDVGNRLLRSRNGINETYTYYGGTNSLEAIAGGSTPRTFTYDENGNIIGDGTLTFIYDQSNRLVEVWQGTEVIAEYGYNALGQRVKKTAQGATTVYHYDLEGKLIAEGLPDGAIVREYLYMGKVRIAMVEIGAEDEVLYHYLNDRLGTPEILTDAAGTVVWEAWYEPFGQAHIHPSSSVVNNHRFPGQYYDEETGLHYNYHRYYDPRTGRYITPDPIGQAGGLNLFIYGQNHPINLIDPLGLVNPKRIALGALQATGGLIGIGLAATANIGSAGTATLLAIGLAGVAVPAFGHGVGEMIAGFLESKKQEIAPIPPANLPAVMILAFKGADFRTALWAEIASSIILLSGSSVKIFGATELITADKWKRIQIESAKLGIDILDLIFDSIALQEMHERESVCD